ncbi:similar to Saccharomyces cerevisiae YEL025C Putative protein of unknown function [Maudiozyma barnettii]|uniref:Uncharacterized protein n=1 Tax=Maudiozyma barnettii TaxID=61262 RepID=A0A8H2VFQ7_9SACH|nr:uncharacterized protein KABA2_04S11616 [Kazachstania barnettii]CAB4254670.1 similar to Saccharomyces cerevisiae YEL025C Putative protein of unknown function [Kazachstania barnettii]CAD1782712.1 similar to Saccharomyces cerevisiae YEL025C Putative protein of unknown function [Kazachstania barnettii]
MWDGKIVLNEIPTTANKIINCFVTINNILLIIETECIRYGQYINNNQELDLKTLKRKQLIGYVSYATLYLEPLTRKQYLFLVMQDGRIDIRDSQLDVIDTIDTDIPFYDNIHSIITIFEEYARILYINLRKDCIHMIRLQLKNDVLRFLHTDKSITLIQTLTSTIMSMDISLEYDIYTNEEFTSIGILSRVESTGQYYFQALYRKNGNLMKNKLKWGTLIEQTKILPLNDETKENINANPKVIMKSIENVGFFLFTLSTIMFITLPNGFENIFAGQSIKAQEIYSVQGPYLMDVINLEENRNLKLNGIIDVNFETASIEFIIFTNTFQLIKIRIIKMMEDDEKFIKLWGKFNITNQKMINIPSSSDDNIVNLYYFKELNQYLLELKSDRLVLAKLNILDPLSIIKYEKESFICSSTIGNHSKRIIRTGFTQNNNYFIDQESTGLENMYHFENLFVPDTSIVKVWTTIDGNLYWLDSTNELFFNGKSVDHGDYVIHITCNNKIVTNNSVISAVDIWNAELGCHCYVVVSGDIKWETKNGTLTSKLPELEVQKLPKIIIHSSMKWDGTNITLCANENRIMLTSDYGKSFKTINCPEFLGTISSIFYHEVNHFCNILVSDIHGKVWVLDGETFQSAGLLNINSYTSSIVGLHNSNNLIIFSDDAFAILYPDTKNKLRYEYVPLDIPYNITHIVSDCSNKRVISLIIVTSDNLVLRMNLDLKLNETFKSVHRTYTDILINKFVRLESSNRFLVASYITMGKKGGDRNIIDKNGICVYDAYKSKIVSSYDTTKDLSNAITTDISSASYQFDANSSEENETKISFAKQLIFDQCFVVSLNYEIAETDKGPKLLLFMLNSESGEIELQTTIDTFYNVNCLYNYEKNLFVACGDCIQLFKLDYSVQENIFHIVPFSNKIYVSGYVKQIYSLPNIVNINDTSDETKHDKKRVKRQVNQKIDFVGTDILRGFYECVLETENSHAKEDSVKYTFKPVKATEIHPIISDIFREKIITEFHFTKYEGFFYFLVCCGLNKVKIYMTSLNDVEYNLIDFYLPSQVTSACAIYKDGNEIDPTKNILIENSRIEELFSITSITGGHYTLGVLKEKPEVIFQNEISKKNMTLQLKSIGAIDDDDDDDDIHQFNPQLIDNRILCDDTVNHIHN